MKKTKPLTETRKEAAPPARAEQLQIDQPDDFEIQVRKFPRIIPGVRDTQRWERWIDSLITATVAATIVLLINHFL